MKILYLANIRLPTEKAHGLQIMHMCEAFACIGADLTLLVPRRHNTAEMAIIRDIYAYYGVNRNFAVQRLSCLDIFRFVPDVRAAAFVAHMLRTLTYILSLCAFLLSRS